MVEAEVAAGDRVAGDRLPTVRALAAQLGVSPNTVAAAYKQLRDRGVVIGRGRQGTVIAPRTRPTVSQLATVPAGAVDALRGSPDPALLPDLGAAFAAATAGGHVQYGDQLVDDHFAAAARAVFRADGVDATHLTVTSGAMDAIEKLLVANDLRPGDRVGVEDPGHVPVHQIVRAAGLELVPLTVDEHGITPEALDDALHLKLAALIVTPRAQNPTGAAFTKERARDLSDLLANHGDVFLVQDDHAGAISGADWFPIRPPGPRQAIIRSVGKSLGPDLRLSAVVGDELTIDRVSMAVSNGPGWVSHMLQRAAAHLLSDASTQALVLEAAASYSARRHRLISALSDRGVTATGASGINVWIPTGDEQATVANALAAGFAIRGADNYRVHSGPAVRVTISALSDEQIDALADALAKPTSPQHHSPSI